MADAFPERDPVGPVDGATAMREHRGLLASIARDAERVDAQGVPRDTIDALARAGLLGTPLPPADQRELTESLAGADAATGFCWAQHQWPLRTIEESPTGAEVRTRLLEPLRTGAQLSAVAFAHVRRPGAPNPVATRIDGGWRLDGTLDWVTSWDIADVVMVLAEGSGDDAGCLIAAFLPAGRAPHGADGLSVGTPLALLAMAATHTRPVTLAGVVVTDSDVAQVIDREQWLAADGVSSAAANPATFGIARGAIAELDAIAEQRSDAGLASLVDALVAECRELRARNYGLVDADAAVAERLAVRAACLDHAVRATTAVVVARAGAAMIEGRSAQRRMREALFLLVQAQTAASRAASVELLTRRAVSG